MGSSLSVDTFVKILSDSMSQHESYFVFVTSLFPLFFVDSNTPKLSIESAFLFHSSHFRCVQPSAHKLFDQYLIIAILLCKFGTKYQNITDIFTTNTKITQPYMKNKKKTQIKLHNASIGFRFAHQSHSHTFANIKFNIQFCLY